MQTNWAQPDGSSLDHPFFDDVEQLLVPSVLSGLTGRHVEGVRLRPLSSVDGRSGGQLQAVDIEDGASYVLKRISWQNDAFMRMTDDYHGRAVLAWRKGLLDRLPPQTTHGILACARDGDGWAILMEDYRCCMLPPHEERLSAEDETFVVGALAALHEAFWDLPSSAVEEYRLCPLPLRYEAFTPRGVLREVCADLPIIPYIVKGWELFPEVVEPDVADIVQSLHADPAPLHSALGQYPHTLIHGDCHPGNLGVTRAPMPSLVLLDWSSIGLGPPAVDLAEYLFVGVWRLAGTKDDAIARYRELLGLRLGSRFDDAWWLPQLELALLGEFLRFGFDKAQVAANGNGEAIRARERDELIWWSRHIRRAAELL